MPDRTRNPQLRIFENGIKNLIENGCVPGELATRPHTGTNPTEGEKQDLTSRVRHTGCMLHAAETACDVIF